MQPSHGITAPAELLSSHETNVVTVLIRAAMAFFFFLSQWQQNQQQELRVRYEFRIVTHFQTGLHCAAAMWLNVGATRDPSSKQTMLWCTSSVKTHRTMRHCRRIPRLPIYCSRSDNNYQKKKKSNRNYNLTCSTKLWLLLTTTTEIIIYWNRSHFVRIGDQGVKWHQSCN